MAPDTIERRLQEAARLSRVAAESERGRADMRVRALEARRDAWIDMSPDAIDQRIREVAALRRLCLDLAVRPERALTGG
ncbi:MAG: hypothetical protein IT379_42335 [Deltaproteobacteria bacterium]|nr:hypothetical protein [Deltaproteobacteria bacterium]